MNRNDMFRSIGEIDDDILERSECASRSRRKIIGMKWIAVAACLSLVAIILIPLIGGNIEWSTQGPQKLNLEGTVLQTGDGSLVYHTDNFDEHIIAFTMVLKKDIPYCYTAFTAYNILSEQVDDEGVIHQETEQFKIITTCPYYEENVSYTTIDNLLSITVNGVEVDTMPTTPGTYEVVIDYSELYVLFDVVEDYVQVWFADLVINSSRFSE